MKRWILRFAMLALVGAVSVAWFGYRAWQSAHEPFKGYSETEIFFSVERGSPGQQIGSELAERGIVRDATLFAAALRYRGDTAKLKAGEYLFDEALSLYEVIDHLVEGKVYTFPVTIPEGLTLVETAAHLERQGVASKTALMSVFQSPASIRAIDPEASDLEGYLFPSTYRFPREPSPQLVARTLVDQFLKIYDDERRQKAAERSLTPRQLVTLASVIEKETGRASERPLIGSVFWNRLKIGMPLQSDPTVIYALKREGRYDGNIRRADLDMVSPYNTYRVPGIPPGPIASPGIDSIDAVLDPADTSYLYFVSKNDGTSKFSATLREHNNAVRKYQIDYFRRQRRNRRARDKTR